jgi:hypothetical protein
VLQGVFKGADSIFATLKPQISVEVGVFQLRQAFFGIQEVSPKTLKLAETVQSLYFTVTTLLPYASPAGSVEG